MISLCIPTKNAGPDFARNLRAWRQQRLEEELELILVDSGSRDATVETARGLGARVESIPPQEFNHGETRNRLARQARGDLLIFTVQDACPANDAVAAELTRPLRQQPELAGVTGRQIPHPDADPVARWQVEAHNSLLSAGPPLKRVSPGEAFPSGDCLTRLRQVAFDNVCSALRRGVWEKYPFARIGFAEDLEWGVRVLRAGHSLLRNPAAQVHHSHNHQPYQRLKRAFVNRLALNRILEVPPSLPPELEGLNFEPALEDIGAFLGDLAQQHARLLQQARPVQKLQIRRSTRHRLRGRLKRSRLPGGDWVARRLATGGVHDLLRRNFNHVVELFLQSHGPLAPAQAAAAVLQLGWQQVGDWLGEAYYWCEQQGKVPEWLEDLGGAFSRGV